MEKDIWFFLNAWSRSGDLRMKDAKRMWHFVKTPSGGRLGSSGKSERRWKGKWLDRDVQPRRTFSNDKDL